MNLFCKNLTAETVSLITFSLCELEMAAHQKADHAAAELQDELERAAVGNIGFIAFLIEEPRVQTTFSMISVGFKVRFSAFRV